MDSARHQKFSRREKAGFAEDAPGAEKAKRRRVLPSTITLIAGLALILVASAGPLKQLPNPDAYANPAPFVSWDWWRYALERNASARLPHIEGDFVHLSAPKGTSDVWIADASGLILHTPDNGETWESFRLTDRLDTGRRGAGVRQETQPAESELQETEAKVNSASFLPSFSPIRVLNGALAEEPSSPARGPQGLHFREIVIKDKGPTSLRLDTKDKSPYARAERILELLGDGQRFEDLARQFSDGESRTKSGDRGPLPTGEVSTNTLEALRYLEAGQVSTIVEEPDGLYIFQLVSRVDASGAPLSNTGEIQQRLPETVDDASKGKSGTPASSTTPSNAADEPNIDSIFFLDSNHGWIVGTETTSAEGGSASHIYRTTDGGAAWRQVWTLSDSIITELTFFTPKNGVLIDDFRYRPLFTTDGGEFWNPGKIDYPSGNSLYFFSAPSATSLFGVSHLGDTIFSPDGGESWEKIGSLQLDPSRRVYDTYFVGGGVGWLLTAADTSPGNDLTLYGTNDDGVWASIQTLGSMGAFASRLEFVDEDRGFATSSEGLVRLWDGGKSGEPVAETEGLQFAALAFSGVRNGWAVGRDIMFRTTDGGESWHRMSRETLDAGTYVKFPAPWYVAALIVGFGLCAPSGYFRHGFLRRSSWFSWKLARGVLRGEVSKAESFEKFLDDAFEFPPRSEIPTGETGAGRNLDDDNAITQPDQDRLGFAPLVERTAHFLLNTDTEAGITLAVTGGWGSGKSSFMNLLIHKLRENGYRPVYLNAWQHEKEENILLAILEAIRHHAVPAVWTLQGFVFRLNLVKVRAFQPPYFAPFIVAFALWVFSLLVLLATPDTIFENPETAISESGAGVPTPALFAITGKWINEFKTPTGLDEFVVETIRSYSWAGVTALVGMASFLFVAVLVVKWANIYSVNPLSSLLTAVSLRFRLRDLENRTVSREQFLTTFKEIGDAMGQRRRMTILIDDLDRCSPKHVIDSLEALNYLSGYGKSYLILGVDWQELRKNLQRGFEEDGRIPKSENRFSGTVEPYANEGAKYVSRYMQKLIQVALRVPRRQLSATRREDQPVKVRPIGRREGAMRTVSNLADWSLLSVLAAIVIIMGLGWWWKGQEALEAPATPEKSPVATAETAEEPIEPAAEGRIVEPSIGSGAGNEFSVIRGTYAGPSVVRGMSVPWRAAGRVSGVASGLLVVGGLVLLTLRTTGVPGVRDPSYFEEELNVWSKIVYAADPTPRAVVRFKNQARFLASLIDVLNIREKDYAEKSAFRSTIESRARATVIHTAVSIIHHSVTDGTAFVDRVRDGSLDLEKSDPLNLAQLDAKQRGDILSRIRDNMDALEETRPSFVDLASTIYEQR